MEAESIKKLGQEKEDEDLVVPAMIQVVEHLDYESLVHLMKEYWQINRPIFSNGVTLYSLLMSVDSDVIQKSEATKKNYIEMLKLVKRYQPDLFAVDSHGRTCFHHNERIVAH